MAAGGGGFANDKRAARTTGIRRLYFDVCTLCRPFDDQRALRIHMETDAYYLILRGVQDRRYQMVVSPAHLAEIRGIRDPKERMELLGLLGPFLEQQGWDLPGVRRRAEELVSRKFGVADAAHLAFAEAGADVFLSCDDKQLKKCRRTQVRVTAMNPVEFCVSEELR